MDAGLRQRRRRWVHVQKQTNSRIVSYTTHLFGLQRPVDGLSVPRREPIAAYPFLHPFLVVLFFLLVSDIKAKAHEGLICVGNCSENINTFLAIMGRACNVSLRQEVWTCGCSGPIVTICHELQKAAVLLELTSPLCVVCSSDSELTL